MQAYITLLCSDDYLKGVLVLNKSLQNVNSKYPLFCAILSTISSYTRDILIKNNIEIIEITDPLIPSEKIIKANKDANLENWSQSINKLKIFSFTKFEKLVYLDCDLMVLNNIDILFTKPHMAGVNTCRDIMPYLLWHGINSGLMVIEPKEDLTDKLFSVNLPYPDNTPICDQNFIENYYPTWYIMEGVRLEDRFHIQSVTLNEYEKIGYCIDLTDSDPFAIQTIHFTDSPKPWFLSPKERFILIHKVALQNSYTVNEAYKLYFELLKVIEDSL